ncbi:hypothetical protein [Pelagovum pacificum]|uniref:DUF4189 domain-containing protein n=1 Tax=Pelagovum pacificum TaxID=2588711 RepID=A0A5C5GDF7_9RHOB|nr:hypothetical protein [Pelagovum pacificum]QQA44039.1 hypothetical protein I8N54_05540 [Pelagovum pacificum]TNY32832.1 hypothetical protein FHY64_06020 [Pelagovum pacificum]
MTRFATTAFALAAIAAAGPAAAQSVAFAQAPEMSNGTAFAATVGEAIDQAVAQCVEGGAMEEDCIVTTACADAGYSIDIFLQHQEGIHWHETFCGLADQPVAEAVAESVCDSTLRPYLIECMLVQVWDPDGVPLME